MVGAKLANGVRECAQWRVVTHLTLSGAASELADMRHHGVETLVCLLPNAVDVRRQPLHPTRQRQRDDEDLRRGLDDRLHKWGRLGEIGGGCPGNDE